MKEINKLEDIKHSFPYDDILYLEHPTSFKHPRQSMESRAAQFSPFAALTGFDDQIKEVQRLTSSQKSLDETYLEELDTILFSLEQSKEPRFIQVTYFQRDSCKSGGVYLSHKGIFLRVDSYHKQLIFQDKTKILLSDIVKIDILDLSEMDNLI